MSVLFERMLEIFERGGPVMYPLLALSVLSLTLIVERSWFWLGAHRRSRKQMLRQVTELLRRGERSAVSVLVRDDRSPYGAVIRQLLGAGASEAVAIEAVELQRPALDRFMTMLSTIITAAPLLGILGTVLGIIQSFHLVGEQRTITDPRIVSGGIAEALVTTAFGLLVALITLFPYMMFRSQSDHAVGRLESIIAAAQEGERNGGRSGERAGGREDGEEGREDGEEGREASRSGRPAKRQTETELLSSSTSSAPAGRTEPVSAARPRP